MLSGGSLVKALGEGGSATEDGVDRTSSTRLAQTSARGRIANNSAAIITDIRICAT